MRHRRKKQPKGPLAALAFAGSLSVASSFLHVVPGVAGPGPAAQPEAAAAPDTAHTFAPSPPANAVSPAASSPSTLPVVTPTPPTPSATAAASPAPTASAPTKPPAQPVHLVGLGDSVAAGTAADGPNYIQRTATLLGQQRGVAATADVFAVPGITSGDVLSQVRSDASVRQALSSATVVVIEIGANDYDQDERVSPDCVAVWSCYSDELSRMKTNVASITAAVHSLAPGAQVVLVGYWNVWEDGQVGAANGQTYVSVAANLTASHNALVKQVATSAGAAFTSTMSAMRATGDVTNYLASDGDHPNTAGQAALARAVVAALPPPA